MRRCRRMMRESRCLDILGGPWMDGVCPPRVPGADWRHWPRRSRRSGARIPTGYSRKNASKRLAAIAKFAFDVIPQDPARPEYRQGDTLGDDRRHWFRARFFQQYRLFFRYHAQTRVIVFAWVNDEDTLRAYESDDDAYRVFRRMLEGGCPPDDWDALLAEARAEGMRLQRLAGSDTE